MALMKTGNIYLIPVFYSDSSSASVISDSVAECINRIRRIIVENENLQGGI